MIGLVGHSGAGKSTMINLVMRLYDVDSGTIKIDGRDIRDYDQYYLRENMGVVFQETYLSPAQSMTISHMQSRTHLRKRCSPPQRRQMPTDL